MDVFGGINIPKTGSTFILRSTKVEELPRESATETALSDSSPGAVPEEPPGVATKPGGWRLTDKRSLHEFLLRVFAVCQSVFW